MSAFDALIEAADRVCSEAEAHEEQWKAGDYDLYLPLREALSQFEEPVEVPPPGEGTMGVTMHEGSGWHGLPVEPTVPQEGGRGLSEEDRARLERARDDLIYSDAQAINRALALINQYEAALARARHELGVILSEPKGVPAIPYWAQAKIELADAALARTATQEIPECDHDWDETGMRCSSCKLTRHGGPAPSTHKEARVKGESTMSSYDIRAAHRRKALDGLGPAPSTPDKEARVEACVTMGCAGRAVAEFRWEEDGLQIGHYCDRCLATMEDHYGWGSTTRYDPAQPPHTAQEGRETWSTTLRYPDHAPDCPMQAGLRGCLCGALTRVGSTAEGQARVEYRVSSDDPMGPALEPAPSLSTEKPEEGAEGMRDALTLLNRTAAEAEELDPNKTPWFHATNTLLVEIANREGKSIKEVAAEMKAEMTDRKEPDADPR